MVSVASPARADVVTQLSPVLCKDDAKALPAAHGTGVPAGVFAAGAGEAVRAAFGLEGPVAMKVQSEDRPHKTWSGGVVLGVEGKRRCARRSSGSWRALGRALARFHRPRPSPAPGRPETRDLEAVPAGPISPLGSTGERCVGETA